jgi:hypothetical protein
MEAQAQPHKDQEEALLNQTHALKIDLNQEQHFPKHLEQVETKENDSLPPLHEVETILDYKFKNKHLLEKAFTHVTYCSEDNLSYERLEYVGDAVLNLLITKEQFFLYPNLQPGQLTRLRAANVDAEKLARVAIKHGLHRYLRHKKPQLEEQVSSFSVFFLFNVTLIMVGYFSDFVIVFLKLIIFSR